MEKWNFRLYVVGNTIHSANAVENLKRICLEHLQDNCHVEVIDIAQHPEAAMRDQIVVVPTLVYLQPSHNQTFIGDLSSEVKVLDFLRIT